MGTPQETAVFSSAYDSCSDDWNDDTAAASGCGCFRRFWFGPNEYERRSYLLHEMEGGRPQQRPWFNKLKEFQEVAVGPKWKNMMRKMSRNRKSRKQNKTGEHLQYTPQTYALNFADAELLHSFSARFAPTSFINDHQRRTIL